ncbi:MAG: GatB/YqeY domain-containing protein [Bdellovibrionales bacterium]|nr:GatB/YqeY domain-containing protein [Bdellovibrionales bacterium]
MSLLKDKIQKSVGEAMKSKQAARLQTLRLIWNAIRKKEIDDRKDLDDAGVEKTILTMMKQVQESLEQAKSAARAEAIAESEAELLILKEFLPEALPESEVQKIVDGVAAALKAAGTLPAGGAGMGAVMKQAMVTIGSRAEGKVIQACVRKSLGMA